MTTGIKAMYHGTHVLHGDRLMECPTCEEDFSTEHGVKIHHYQQHNDSIAQIEKTCNECGDEFTVPESRSDRGRGVYCSKECKHNNGRVSVTCTRCGDTVQRAEHRTGRYSDEYCSRECYLEYRSEGGEAAPGWVDGRYMGEDYQTKYSSDWYPQREKALERDEYTCQDCGMSNEDHLEKIDRGLCVHHIKPLLSFDNTEEAHRVENLVSLCQWCHQKREKSDQKEGTQA